MSAEREKVSPLNEQVWDVAIVGAGPAGATAAIHLSSQGHRVLLIDKDDFPRDKVCGDGLIADSIGALKRAGLYEDVRALAYDMQFCTIYSPSRVQIVVPGEFLTLKRILLDDLILQKAIASGAKFLRRKVTGIETPSDDSALSIIAGADKAIRSRIVILATGADIELSTKVGLVRQARHSALALRCYVRSRFALDRLIISYDRSILPGYAWIFPLGNDEFNIGCGIFYNGNAKSRVNLRNTFQVFVSEFPLAKDIMRRAASSTPLRGARLRCGLSEARSSGAGRILAIGEAIGATFPYTGEGIGKAMETAELAAEVAHSALSSGDFNTLQEFPTRLERELKPKFLGYQIAEDWLSRPWLNDFLARRIHKSRFLQDSVAGILNETVDPKKIFSLRGIIRSFVR